MNAPTPAPRARVAWGFAAMVLAWAVALCVLPDPRPLAAPEWAVGVVRSLAGMPDATARAVATLGLRGGGAALLGLLLMLALGERRWSRRSAIAILLAPLLAMLASWANQGFFPIRQQVGVLAGGAALGAIAGLALRRNVPAAIAIVALVGGLLTWGLATGIADELDAATRAVAGRVLAVADEVPPGDAGFVRLIEIAFAAAAEGPEGADVQLANRAALLALGVILGEEQVADVAGRHVDRGKLPAVEALRRRISLFGRQDWPRHFWVSAALTVLSDADRSLAVGLAKELMDAQPGGTGFSFADLAADAAGNRFALAATRDAAAATAMRARAAAGMQLADLVPDLRDLPEGLSRDAFHTDYGGLGGAGTNRIVEDVQRRLARCAALQ
jgi:hypothetical protein